MYEGYFGLQRTPFSRDIPVHSLYLSRNHQEALARLRYAAQRRLVMLLIGDPGVGKLVSLHKNQAEKHKSLVKKWAWYGPERLPKTGSRSTF